MIGNACPGVLDAKSHSTRFGFILENGPGSVSRLWELTAQVRCSDRWYQAWRAFGGELKFLAWLSDLCPWHLARSSRSCISERTRMSCDDFGLHIELISERIPMSCDDLRLNTKLSSERIPMSCDDFRLEIELTSERIPMPCDDLRTLPFDEASTVFWFCAWLPTSPLVSTSHW